CGVRACRSVVFFQGEDGRRDATVTGVQTCALPISRVAALVEAQHLLHQYRAIDLDLEHAALQTHDARMPIMIHADRVRPGALQEIGRASCRERVESTAAAVSGQGTEPTVEYPRRSR